MNVLDIAHIVSDLQVLHGEPTIAGHRIAVAHVAVWVVYQGATPQEIATEFHLTLGEIYAALAYYYDHKQDMDEQIAETARQAEQLGFRDADITDLPGNSGQNAQ